MRPRTHTGVNAGKQACGGQRTTLENKLFISPLGITGLKSRLSSLATRTFIPWTIYLPATPQPSFSSSCVGLRFLANGTAPGAPHSTTPSVQGRTSGGNKRKCEVNYLPEYPALCSVVGVPCNKTGENARQSWNILNVPAVLTERSRDKEPEVNGKPSVASLTKNLTTQAGKAKQS